MFPSTGFRTENSANPPLITGFLIFDSLISGNVDLAIDVLYHYALPSIVLTVAITALMTRLFSSQVAKDSYKKNMILSNTAKTIMALGVIFTYLILIDVTFGLYGFGSIFLRSLYDLDYFLFRGLVFAFLMIFALTIFVSNLIFSLKTMKKDRILPQDDIEEILEREPNLGAKLEIKNYLNKIVRSPLAIIGLIAVLIPIFIAIFPELVSGHTLEDAFSLDYNQWGPPTLAHLLGQGRLGRDVLTLVVFGARDSLIFGFSAALIGLIGGLAIGLLASKFNRIAHTITMSITLIFYIMPGILLAIALSFYPMQELIRFEQTFGFLLFTTGFLLVPSFTRIITNTKFQIVPMGKKIISYLPLFVGFAISFYMSLRFLGFINYRTVQLGELIRNARYHLVDAPCASLYPGLIAFLIIASLFILHEGLAKCSK